MEFTSLEICCGMRIVGRGDPGLLRMSDVKHQRLGRLQGEIDARQHIESWGSLVAVVKWLEIND